MDGAERRPERMRRRVEATGEALSAVKAWRERLPGGGGLVSRADLREGLGLLLVVDTDGEAVPGGR